MTYRVNLVMWLCQLYLAWFFFRSAYRKTVNYEKVSAEFGRWGYPFPRELTFFLIVVWIQCATLLLVPGVASGAAAVLLAFMLVAFLTLMVHREWQRLREPAIPMVMLALVAIGRSAEFAFSMGRDILALRVW